MTQNPLGVMLQEIMEREGYNKSNEQNSISLFGQVHALMDTRNHLLQPHHIRAGDFVKQRKGIGYAKAPTQEQPGLVMEVWGEQDCKRLKSNPLVDCGGRSGVIEDCLTVIHYDSRMATFFFDGRYLELHEEAMTEAYGEDWTTLEQRKKEAHEI